LALQIKKALGFLTPPVILPYRGYGTPYEAHLNGHVLDDRRLYEADEKDRRSRNIKAMLSRYMADAIPGVQVRICFLGQEKIVETDTDGYFEAVFHFRKPREAGWHKATFQAIDKLVPYQEEKEFYEEVLLVDSSPKFGIISDIDDTILVSHATRIHRKLELVLTKNAKTRMPFRGVKSFYNALHHEEKIPLNPVFYVSSSEWNLYDFLEDFCDTQQIPKGVFMLKDLKENLWNLITTGGGSHRHKATKIRRILDLYEGLNFVLIGDSGQRDAEIYAEIIANYPGRILASYIRDVSNNKRDAYVAHLSDSIREKVDMVLVKDTAEAARHAFKLGLLNKEELKTVQKEVLD
jgi:phosphatidate phosphatase APP1